MKAPGRFQYNRLVPIYAGFRLINAANENDAITTELCISERWQPVTLLESFALYRTQFHPGTLVLQLANKEAFQPRESVIFPNMIYTVRITGPQQYQEELVPTTWQVN